MKKIEAIVEPSGVEGVREGLAGIGIRSMAVSEVHVFGAPAGNARFHRGARYEPPYVTESKVEMVVHDESADEVIAFLRQGAKTDEEGAVRVFVFSLDDLRPMRTAKKSVASM